MVVTTDWSGKKEINKRLFLKSLELWKLLHKFSCITIFNLSLWSHAASIVHQRVLLNLQRHSFSQLSGQVLKTNTVPASLFIDSLMTTDSFFSSIYSPTRPDKGSEYLIVPLSQTLFLPINLLFFTSCVLLSLKSYFCLCKRLSGINRERSDRYALRGWRYEICFFSINLT